MTPRWRAVLQVQRLLRVLLANHVPLGVLNVEVDRATHLLDDDLVAAEADISGMGIVYDLARGWAQALVGDEPFAQGQIASEWHVQRERWRQVIDEIRRRARAHRELVPLGSACGEPIALELDKVLRIIGDPPPIDEPDGRPPDAKRLDEFLASREFKDLLQSYRFTPISPDQQAVDAFEAIKAAIRKAAQS